MQDIMLHHSCNLPLIFPREWNVRYLSLRQHHIPFYGELSTPSVDCRWRRSAELMSHRSYSVDIVKSNFFSPTWLLREWVCFQSYRECCWFRFRNTSWLRRCHRQRWLNAVRCDCLHLFWRLFLCLWDVGRAGCAWCTTLREGVFHRWGCWDRWDAVLPRGERYRCVWWAVKWDRLFGIIVILTVGVVWMLRMVTMNRGGWACLILIRLFIAFRRGSQCFFQRGGIGW